MSFSSMGTHARNNQPATNSAQQVCQENGFDISNHLSRQLIEEELLLSQFIFCMEPVQQKFVQMFFPAHRKKIHLLGTFFANKNEGIQVVRDPMGSSLSTYRRVYYAIEAHVKRILPYL